MKQYFVVFSPLAEKQLGSLYAYIAEHSAEEQAERYTSRIVEFCQSFSTFPERRWEVIELRCLKSVEE